MTLRKNGFTYTQVLRGQRSLIYRQTYTENVVYYEVFTIKVRKEGMRFGKIWPEQEVFPGNEDFGKCAWTFRNLESAIKKFEALERSEL